MNRLAQCAHCRHEFEVEPRFIGGLVPCPRCAKVVDVPGTRDPLWWLLVGGGAVLVLGASVLVGTLHGTAFGLVAFAVLAAAGLLLTRAL